MCCGRSSRRNILSNIFGLRPQHMEFLLRKPTAPGRHLGFYRTKLPLGSVTRLLRMGKRSWQDFGALCRGDGVDRVRCHCRVRLWGRTVVRYEQNASGAFSTCSRAVRRRVAKHLINYDLSSHFGSRYKPRSLMTHHLTWPGVTAWSVGEGDCTRRRRTPSLLKRRGFARAIFYVALQRRGLRAEIVATNRLWRVWLCVCTAAQAAQA